MTYLREETLSWNSKEPCMSFLRPILLSLPKVATIQNFVSLSFALLDGYIISSWFL